MKRLDEILSKYRESATSAGASATSSATADDEAEACPHCGSHSLTRRGTRKKTLEIVQLWRCSSCKRVFTPGPAALRNKTYPLSMILSALTVSAALTAPAAAGASTRASSEDI